MAIQRLLIPEADRARLIAASGERRAALIADMRADRMVPSAWRMCPSFEGFYNPDGWTADEIAAYDAAQPNFIDNRELMRRLTPPEHLGLDTLSRSDANICKLWNTIKAGGQADVHSAEFKQGVGYIRAVCVPSIWADTSTFDARMADITKP